jgi:autotransporter-associated beta strand protein
LARPPRLFSLWNSVTWVRVTGTSFTFTAGDLTLDVGGGTVDAVDLAATFTCGQPIQGFGGLTKAGAGTLVLSAANTYGGGTTVSAGMLLVANTTGSGTGTGPVTVGAATLGGTGIISGPVTLTGDSTLTSSGTLTLNNTLTISGDANHANQLPSGTILTSGNVTIDPGAVFIINGTLGGGASTLIVRGTLMGKGTINKSCVIEAGGVLSPGSPSTIQGMAQMVVGGGPQTLAFEIGAAGPNYASPTNSVNDLVRLMDTSVPFADATGGAAALTADTVIDVYFLSADPALGGYKAEFFAATDFTDAIADATYQFWHLDPHGTRFHNGNLYSPLDASLVDWSVVPETATFDGAVASGYITQFTVVPEPATLALLALGGLGALLLRRK